MTNDDENNEILQACYLVNWTPAPSSVQSEGRRCAVQSTSQPLSADRGGPGERREDDRTRAHNLCCCLRMQADFIKAGEFSQIRNKKEDK